MPHKNAPRRVRFCFLKADCKSAVVLFDGHVTFEIGEKVFLQIGGLLESNQNDFSETLFVKGNQRDSVLVDLAPRERRTKRNTQVRTDKVEDHGLAVALENYVRRKSGFKTVLFAYTEKRLAFVGDLCTK